MTHTTDGNLNKQRTQHAHAGSIFVLESKYIGSNQQLDALARAVGHGRQIVRIKCELRSRNRLLFPLLRAAIWIKRNLPPNSRIGRLITTCTLKNVPNSVRDEDVIVSKTAPFEWPSMLLAAGTRAKTIHLGAPRRFDADSFSYIVSTPSTPCQNAKIQLDVLPTPPLHNSSEKPRHTPDVTRWTLLIGGNARGYNYGPNFWQRMGQFIKQTARENNIEWQITSSPRTGADTESRLDEALRSEKDGQIEAYWWTRHNERKSVSHLLENSDAVFVTEDSASMVSEAANSGLPTIILVPTNRDYNPQTQPLAQHLSNKRAAIVLDIEQLEFLHVTNWIQHAHQPLKQRWSEIAASATINLNDEQN